MYRTSSTRGLHSRIPQFRATPIPMAFVPRPSKKLLFTRPTTRPRPGWQSPPLIAYPSGGDRTTTKYVAMNTLPMVDGLDRNLAGPILDNDPPIFEQAMRFDAPSLTLYMGTNKIALIPALLSALAVKLILFSGSKVSQTFAGAPSGKAARA